MEVNTGRQVAFSFLAASGVFAMHFTGMAAATFYSSAPPADAPGYPAVLGFLIVALAILSCFMSRYADRQSIYASRPTLIRDVKYNGVACGNPQ